MSGLPRELLKWLQSLDLTYSVKNVKRDFSNGFLVAEIFSRYYVADVEMHSYDNGLSLTKKLDNWQQLKKFFAKNNITIPPNLIDDVVHSKSQEAAAELISIVYSLLTGRTINAPKFTQLDPADPSSDPAYTRPNASALLSSNMKESEMATTLQDQTTAAARAKALIDDHSDVQRSMRETEPARYALPPGGTTSGTSMQRMLRGPPKPVPQEIEAAQVRFQEVRVTAVDRNIAQLRASRDAHLHGGNSFASSTAAPVEPVISSGGGAGPPPQPPPTSGTVDVVALLSDVTLSHCPEILSYLGAAQSPRAFGELVGSLALLPLAEVQTLFQTATATAAEPLANACRAEPGNAWQVFALLTPPLANANAAPAFDAVCDFLIAFGKALADDRYGSVVLTKYALPFLLPLLHSLTPAKAPRLLSLVYAFVKDTAAAHIDAIRALQEALDDQKAFVTLLPYLVTLEPAFEDDLFNLYIYYGVMALDLKESRLRAAAIGVLAVLADVRYNLILELLPKLGAIDDPWWEVQAQMARLCATLLRRMPAEQSTGPLDLLAKALSSRCHATQILALSAAAPTLSTYPDLLPPFIDSLLSLPSDKRIPLLEAGPASAVEVAIAGGAAMEAATLPPVWPALEVATELMASARARKLDTLELPYAEVLTALVPAVSTASSPAGWAEWLKVNKDYLYVALCEEALCPGVSSFILALFKCVAQDALPTFSTLLTSLKIMCDHGDVGGICHRTVVRLLSDLYDMGPPFAEAITELVTKQFDKPMLSAFDELVKKVEGA